MTGRTHSKESDSSRQPSYPPKELAYLSSPTSCRLFPGSQTSLTLIKYSRQEYPGSREQVHLKRLSSLVSAAVGATNETGLNPVARCVACSPAKAILSTVFICMSCRRWESVHFHAPRKAYRLTAIDHLYRCFQAPSGQRFGEEPDTNSQNISEYHNKTQRGVLAASTCSEEYRRATAFDAKGRSGRPADVRNNMNAVGFPQKVMSFHFDARSECVLHRMEQTTIANEIIVVQAGKRLRNRNQEPMADYVQQARRQTSLPLGIVCVVPSSHAGEIVRRDFLI